MADKHDPVMRRPRADCHEPRNPGPEAGEWMQQATVAIRARVPLPVLRDVIQPFPTFSEIYVAALKALNSQIAATRATPATAAHA